MATFWAISIMLYAAVDGWGVVKWTSKSTTSGGWKPYKVTMPEMFGRGR